MKTKLYGNPSMYLSIYLFDFISCVCEFWHLLFIWRICIKSIAISLMHALWFQRLTFIQWHSVMIRMRQILCHSFLFLFLVECLEPRLSLNYVWCERGCASVEESNTIKPFLWSSIKFHWTKLKQHSFIHSQNF